MPDQFEEFRKTLGADKVDNFLACLGLGPKYIPKPRKLYTCIRCASGNATCREAHADTDMNCMEFHCQDCGHTWED